MSPQLRIDKLKHQGNISILRLDRLDPQASGNKLYKLRYNLAEAKNLGYDKILTFGGAYSNHIHATAAAAKKENLSSIGIIRGEATDPLNETLTYAAAQGMNLNFISRSDYRKKDDKDFLQELKQKFGDYYLLPEGGSNELAVKGVAEIINKVSQSYDLWILPVGTGGTLAGIVAGLEGEAEVLGISALKGAHNLKEKVHSLLINFPNASKADWQINHDYHFGGYAKMTEELYAFISEFNNQQGMLLDPIYTGKMMFAIYDLIRSGKIPAEKRILAIHTGGLQGWNGMISRYGFVKQIM
jgi:1-aminocyclopropane-1-carboxylate deaminase